MKKTAFLLTALLLLLASCCAFAKSADDLAALGYLVTPGSSEEATLNALAEQDLDAFHRDALTIMEAMRDSEKMAFGDASLAFSALNAGEDTYIFAVFDGLDFALEC